MQFYYVAVGDRMIWSYLLSSECRASPQPGEFERPSDILVHKPSDIGHCVGPTDDERPCPVGWMTGQLGVHTHNAQCVEDKWRDSLEAVPALCRDRDGGEANPPRAVGGVVVFDAP